MVFYHGSPDRLRQSFFFLVFCVPSLHHNLGATEIRTTSPPSSHSMKPPVISSGFRIGEEQPSCLGHTDFRGLSRKKHAVLAVSSSGREDRVSKLTRLKKMSITSATGEVYKAELGGGWPGLCGRKPVLGSGRHWWKQHKCLSREQWISKTWSLHVIQPQKNGNPATHYSVDESGGYDGW